MSKVKKEKENREQEIVSDPILGEVIMEIDGIDVPQETRPEVTPTVKSEESNKTSFNVLGNDGGVIRTYSIADHGENAEALAYQYASKIGAKVS